MSIKEIFHPGAALTRKYSFTSSSRYHFNSKTVNRTVHSESFALVPLTTQRFPTSDRATVALNILHRNDSYVRMLQKVA